MNYDDAQTAASVAQTANEERNKGILDRNYYRGIPGLLKGLEAILSFIAFVCVAVVPDICVVTTDGYFKFVTMGAFVAVLVLWVLLLFKIPQRILRCACVNWIYIEFVFHGILIIFYFFANLFMSIQTCQSGARQAGVAFGWFAFVPFCVDFAFAIRKWLASRKEAASQTSTDAAPQVTVDSKY